VNISILQRFLLTGLWSCALLYQPQAMAEESLRTSFNANPFNDWTPDANNLMCGGAYTLPQFPENPATQTEITANSGEFLPTGTSTLMGDVWVKEGYRRLNTDLLYIHRDKNTQDIESLDAQGHVLLEEPFARMLADKAQVDLLNKETILFDTQFRNYESHARGTSEKITYIQNQPLNLYQATYTTCAPDSNVWALRASHVELDNQEGAGVARDAFLYLKDIPVFYTPYITFPIGSARKSGFLAPSYGSSTDDGSTIMVPYYFNLAPNYDDTFMPQWYQKRGLLWRNEFRYLTGHLQGDLQTSYLRDDQQYTSFKSDSIASGKITDPFDPRLEGVENNRNDRYAISYSNLANFNQHWSSEIIYNTVSDDNYYFDFPLQPSAFNNTLNSRQLLRLATIDYKQLHWDASLKAQEYQILQPFDEDVYDEPYKILPQLLVNGYYNNVGVRGVDLGLRTEVTRFTHDDALFTDTPLVVGDRFDFAPVLQYTFERPYIYSTPQVEWRYSAYHLERDALTQNLDYADDVTRTLPLLSVDNGLRFERDMNLFSNSYTQTLEPRLSYLYVPYQNQNDIPVFDDGLLFLNYDQLFRNNRFAGRDRIGDANQMALGASSSFLDMQTGHEYARLAIGQLYYFEDRNVTLCNTEADPGCIIEEDPYNDYMESTSDIVLQGDFRFHPKWSVSSNMLWNPAATRVDQYGLRVGYTHDKQKLINFGYTKDLEDQLGLETINQTDISGVWAFNPVWKLIARWQYDYDMNTSLSTFVGVEYEDCCWAVRLGSQRAKTISDIDTYIDNAIYIQFVLKGLTSFGSDYTDFVRTSVPGYQDTLGKTYQ